MGLSAHWAAKDVLFRWPFAGLLRWMGGIPVNRQARRGFVDQMAEQFAARPTFYLTMAPEGTRGREAGWKTGFCRIALAAGVPVALGCVDYVKREIGILVYLKMTSDPEANIAHIAAVYAGRRGRVDECASSIRWLD